MSTQSIYIPPSSGGNMEIGNPVVGATIDGILFAGHTGDLAQLTGFTLEDSTGNVLVPNALIAGQVLGSVISLQPLPGLTQINTLSTDGFIQKLIFNDAIGVDSTILLPEGSGTLCLSSDLDACVLVDGSHPMTGDLDLGGNKIINLDTPTSDTDAANKAYVDTFVTGLSPKTAVRVATAIALPASSYDNGVDGLGATITADAVGILTVDGVATILNDRILVKNQAAPAQNGIYLVTTAGTGGVEFVLTRSTDTDTPAELVSAYTYTGTEGATQANKGYVQATPATITIGTSPIVWNLFNSSLYGEGTGIRISAGNLIYSKLSEGVTGGQDLIGGTAADDTLTIKGSSSTSSRTTTDPAVIIKSMGVLGDDNTAQTHLSIPVSVTQTSTAGYTAVKVSVTENTLGSGTKNLFELLAGGSGTSSKFSVDNAGSITLAKNINMSEDGHIVIGTTTGTKIGTSTSQKLAFYNSTPIIKPTGYVLDALSNLGLIATPNMCGAVNIQTGASYNFALADMSPALVVGNRATPQTFHILPSSTLAFPVGAQIDVIQYGAGAITFVADPGATLNVYGTTLLTTSGQFIGVTLKQIILDTWILMGNTV